MNTSIVPEFSKLTVDVTKRLSKTVKKEQGIFITPHTIIHKFYHRIVDLGRARGLEFRDILEPSCGTCEIVNYLDNVLSGVSIDAIEKNDMIFREISSLSFSNEVMLFHQDFMSYITSKRYSLILGNPPYIACHKDDLSADYQPYLTKKTNLMAAFILHSMELLQDGGIMAFILPARFMNSAYYAGLRLHMKTRGEILDIVDFGADNKFLDTQQATVGLIFKRCAVPVVAPCAFSVLFGETYVFTTDAAKLRSVLAGSTTLAALGFRVRTGTVVWNQHKPKLTDDTSKTLLLYNTNLVDGRIQLREFANVEKKQYIDMAQSTGPCIVVNRGHGNSCYSLQYAYVDEEILGTPFLVENHLHIIYSLSTDREEVKKGFDLISKSFTNPKTEIFIDMFLGNNGLSKTELETIFPIYLSTE
jgi:adenine-specific DNA-methyltransferase